MVFVYRIKTQFSANMDLLPKKKEKIIIEIENRFEHMAPINFPSLCLVFCLFVFYWEKTLIGKNNEIRFRCWDNEPPNWHNQICITNQSQRPYLSPEHREGRWKTKAVITIDEGMNQSMTTIWLFYFCGECRLYTQAVSTKSKRLAGMNWEMEWIRGGRDWGWGV